MTDLIRCQTCGGSGEIAEVGPPNSSEVFAFCRGCGRKWFGADCYDATYCWNSGQKRIRAEKRFRLVERIAGGESVGPDGLNLDPTYFAKQADDILNELYGEVPDD